MPDRLPRPRLAGFALLLALLAAQALFSRSQPRAWQAELSPGAPPSVAAATLLTLGERAAAAYAMTLYVQTFDSQAGASLGIASLDLMAVRDWLDRSLDLYPQSAYPLLLAARVYAGSARPEQARALLEVVERRFIEAPHQRWQWLAHAVYIARHELNDGALALRYARILRERTTGIADVPAWARQTELLLLADSDQHAAAQVLLGALLDSGQVADPAERSFLLGRLEATRGRPLPDGRPLAQGQSGRNQRQ